MAWLQRLFLLRPLLVGIAAKFSWLPPLVARITVGWVFVLSGWGKLHALPDIVEYFRTLGIPAPEIQAPFASGTELVCGALILVGLLSRLAAVPLMVVMTVAIMTARFEELTSAGALFGFIEWLYIALLLWIAVAGPGPLSLDGLLFRKSGRA
ncbi:MAG TPA: DoxX family protein [Candidatus Polarisedimenticolia bacterium]|nr:DoxX family protein [Candidatus Polarisedimenticolia bacterium]